MIRLTIEKIGDTQGIFIPADVMARLNIKVGDVVTIDEANPQANVVAGESKRERILRMVAQIMEEDDNLLRRRAQ